MTAAWDWPGAKWWRVDLHAHSPASHDFRGQAAQDDESWILWLESARDAGIQAIAVTDHNTADAVTHLQRVAPSVENAPVVFPGVELTASDGSHLLCIFDPSSSQSHVEDLLSRVGIGVDQRGKEESRSTQSVEQILEECGDNVLVIGAHVNSEAGLLMHGGQQRIAELRNPRLIAVEVKPDVEIDDSWLDGSKKEIGRTIPQIQASDSHNFDNLGQRFTWIKMTKPDIEGLRLALSDGEASLEPSSSGASADPNNHAPMAIEKITVHNAKFVGREAPTVVHLNPCLNTIIGSRGTGKSTLVDFCRKTLGRESELDSTVSQDEGSLRNLFDRRMKVPSSRTGEGLLTDNTRIEVVYRQHGEQFLITWGQDGNVQPICRLDGNSLIPEDGNIDERFPVRIYSQKQLFALAQEPNALLKVIDEEVRSVELERQIAQLKAQYLSLRASARVAFATASELPARKAELDDVRRKLSFLEQSRHSQILSTYRDYRQIDDTWNSIVAGVEKGLEAVTDSVNGLSVADIGIDPGKNGDIPRAALSRSHQSLGQIVADIQRSVMESISNARQRLEDIRSSADSVTWREAVEASEAEYYQASSQLVQEGISEPSNYSGLLDQEKKLEDSIKNLNEELLKAQSLEEGALNTLAQYRAVRKQLSEKRQGFANGASSDTLNVQVNAFADHSGLPDALVRELGTDRFEEDRRSIAGKIQPESNGQWDWDRLDTVVERMRTSQLGGTDPWEIRDARFRNILANIKPESIDRLALYMPSDDVQIKFKERGFSSDWRPLSQGSPGQQTAALLAFVLGFGAEPIILDQPEDDLDNTLIYDLLVSRFKEAKLKRQMVVITHNPNIVVHGDSEFVVSLKAQNSQTRIAQQGGLQEKAVRDEICLVMEGGREAFEIRYRRIIPA